MTNTPGQIDIFEVLHTHGEVKERKAINASRGDERVEYQKLPAEISDWYRDHMADWWYGEDECIGCGQVECRQALYTGHGVQFDQNGTQYLPAGPRMAEEGVCMLMSFTAMHADIAMKIAAKDPRFADWRRQCFKHESPTNKKKCPQSCFAEDAEHRARIATKVWGSEAWRERGYT